jgi:serine/threonine protein kinase
MVGLQLPALIDRYELRERLGAGGMARVYKAWDTRLERWVAIKILHDHLADDPNFKDRFEREAKFIASLSHPNIVQVFDYKRDESFGEAMYYMVMPLIEGQTLRQLVIDENGRFRRLPVTRLLQITKDLTDALAYAHEQGMVHRDVKPGNVLISTDGRAILTDFGIARMAASARTTLDGTSSGTPTYMSPEQATGEAGDARSDLYSLGIIVYELLCGQPPFPDEGNVSVMLKHVSAPHPKIGPLMGADMPRLEAFFDVALAKDPEDRFQSGTAFYTAFKQALTGSTDHVANIRINRLDGETLIVPAIGGGVTTRTANLRHTLVFRTLTQVITPGTPASRTFYLVLGAVAFILLGVVLASFLQRRSAGTVPMSEDLLANFAPIDADASPFFRTRFDPTSEYNENWVQGDYGSFTLALTDDGFYRLRNEQMQVASVSVFTGGAGYGNVSISMEGYLSEESAEQSAYGIVFRYQDLDNYNVFAVDGSGRYSIWTRTDGVWNSLSEGDMDWIENPAVRPIGSSNTLTVDILSGQITGYVNNRRVVRLRDETFDGGQIGVYIASDDGIVDVFIDTYQVFPSVPSMTGQ